MAVHANNGMIFLEFLSLWTQADDASKRTSRSTHEIRWQRVSRTIPSLKADCSPSTVGRMSDGSFAIISQHYTIRILRKSREIYTATDQNKIQSFINKSKKNGYCSPDLTHFNNLCTSMKVDLFNKVLKIPIHVLNPLLPPPPVIHSDMVYDQEHMTGLYQKEPQILWIVTSSSECYIWTHTD